MMDKETYLLQQSNYLVNEILTEMEQNTDVTDHNPNFTKNLEKILYHRLLRVYNDVEDFHTKSDKSE